MLIYVDNVLFLGNNWTLLMKKKQQLMHKCESWDLGKAKEYLRIRITRDCSKRILKLDQVTYTQKVIDHFDMQNCRPSHVPLPTGYNPNPSTEESNPQLQSCYQSVIRSLLYIMLGTQPDLAYSVIKMLQFSTNPTEDHLKWALYVYCLLPDYHQRLTVCLTYKGMSKERFLAYSDTDWAGDLDT